LIGQQHEGYVLWLELSVRENYVVVGRGREKSPKCGLLLAKPILPNEQKWPESFAG
jgi:hypothetical protein